MTPALKALLRSMSGPARRKMEHDSLTALRAAWENRHTHPLRAGIVIRANVTMLRNLRAS